MGTKYIPVFVLEEGMSKWKEISKRCKTNLCFHKEAVIECALVVPHTRIEARLLRPGASADEFAAKERKQVWKQQFQVLPSQFMAIRVPKEPQCSVVDVEDDATDQRAAAGCIRD